MKRCPHCRQTKPLSEFNRMRDGFQAWCRDCKRLRTTGCSPARYAELLDLQDGACAICRGRPGPNQPGLNADHCHSTGRVRGLLCARCNLALGRFEDNPTLTMIAAAYLVVGLGCSDVTLTLTDQDGHSRSISAARVSSFVIQEPSRWTPAGPAAPRPAAPPRPPDHPALFDMEVVGDHN